MLLNTCELFSWKYDFTHTFQRATFLQIKNETLSQMKIRLLNDAPCILMR